MKTDFESRAERKRSHKSISVKELLLRWAVLAQRSACSKCFGCFVLRLRSALRSAYLY